MFYYLLLPRMIWDDIGWYRILYVYIYMYMHIYICIYNYIYTKREREREREIERDVHIHIHYHILSYIILYHPLLSSILVYWTILSHIILLGHTQKNVGHTQIAQGCTLHFLLCRWVVDIHTVKVSVCLSGSLKSFKTIYRPHQNIMQQNIHVSTR